jgi:hypothetical protein
MKIALIEIRKMTPLQNMNHPSRAKKTYRTKTAELVPDFAARWRSIRKNISSSDDK